MQSTPGTLNTQVRYDRRTIERLTNHMNEQLKEKIDDLGERLEAIRGYL